MVSESRKSYNKSFVSKVSLGLGLITFLILTKIKSDMFLFRNTFLSNILLGFFCFLISDLIIYLPYKMFNKNKSNDGAEADAQ